MANTGFETVPTEVLLVIRDNLQRGMDSATDHFVNGTLDTVVGGPKSCPPRAAAQLTLALFFAVTEVLDNRNAL